MILMHATLIAVFVAAFGVLISRRVRANTAWSSMVTPLASIIGSGFLVSVPLLAGAVGIWAVAAVLGLTVLAYLIGGAIRYNIRYGGPIFDPAQPGHVIKSIETLSHVVLTGAYFISVAYYLVLLAEFGMRLIGLTDALIANWVATAIVAVICAVGTMEGLDGVQRAEKFTVSANLAAIAALLASLAIFGFDLPPDYGWATEAEVAPSFDWSRVRFLMGLLIIVQGFETTRFMSQMYDVETRVSAMRRAQIVSSIVYVLFFILMIPLFPYFTSDTDVAGVISVIDRVNPWLPYLVAGAAIASQFSASVADSIGASGLITETTQKHINANHSYILIAAVAIFVIWATDVVSIVALASRAFALFYALQCAVAFLVARHRGDLVRAVAFGALAALALAVATLGIPAGGA
ncbi:MAG: hypothetical protein PVH89_05670 [Gammaproteobacteria bacterium]|jgi:hypothetical protein